MGGGDPGGIGCDAHPGLPAMRELLAFLDPYWREQITVRGIEAPDLASFPARIAANCRADWRPAHGRAGADLATLRAQALEAFGTRAATCNLLSGVQAVHNPHLATALARGPFVAETFAVQAERNYIVVDL